MSSTPVPERGYRFQLLRYRPNVISGELYNVAVVLFDADGRVVDARFASEFSRMQCHPAVEMEFLVELRTEFEEQRLLGEGFTEYLDQLRKNLSGSLDLSEESFFLGGDPATEMDLLMRSYVHTPPPLVEAEKPASAPAAGSRRALRLALERTFDDYRLFSGTHALRRDEGVRYGEGRRYATFDFGYEPAANGRRNFVHAIGAVNDFNDSLKLGRDFSSVRSFLGKNTGLAVVLDAGVQQDTRDELASYEVELVEAADANRLARRIQAELGR